MEKEEEKKENAIPTVSEFTKSKDPGFLYGVNEYGIGQKFENLMIEFAKMHMEAKEKALEKQFYECWDNGEEIRIEHIALSHPIENIT